MAGACDPVPGRADTLTAKYGGRAYASMEAVCADPDLDAVVILAPPPQHAPLAKQALQAGKHVLLEKPLAQSVDDGRTLVNLAAGSGLTLACSPFILLGDRQQRVKKLLAGGALGRPVLAVADQFHGALEMWHAGAAQFYRDSRGPLFDVGPYPLSLLIDWFGPVASVSASGGTLIPDRIGLDGKPFRVDVLDFVSAHLRFRSGVLARVDISNVDRGSNLHGLEIHGTAGSLSLSRLMDFNAEMTIAHGNSHDWVEREGDPSAKPANGVDWSAGVYELARAVRERRAPANSASLGLRVLQTVFAIEEAARSGKHIAIEAFS